MPFGVWIAASVTLLFYAWIAYSKEDTYRWAVWLGRHPLEKISRGSNGQLTLVGNQG